MVSIPHGKYSDVALDRELRAIKAAIDEIRTGGISTGTSSVIVTSSGSSGTSVGSTDVRHGIVSLTSGSNSISFSSAMPSAGYTIPRIRCYATDTGVYEDLEAVVSNKTVNGFTVEVIKACTCEYVALL